MTRTVTRPLLIAAALIAALMVGSQAIQADERNFTLINDSSVVIVDVYVSAAQLQDWGDDILGRDVLNPGEAADILFSRFDGEAGQCLYDIRVVGSGGEEGILYDVDLCTTLTVTFR